MTQIIKPPRSSLDSAGSDAGVRDTVAAVIADIGERGDRTVRDHSEKFDSGTRSERR
jgi:histidinol dehydrogenase